MSQKNFLYYSFAVVRVLLYPLSLVYGAVVWLRNRLYDTGFYSSIEFDVPVITVGNLSVGGTGKTPHVEYLIRLLQYQYRVATMSRGYKRRTQGFLLADETSNALHIGDEPMQYKMKYPDLVVSVAEERMVGIPKLLQKRPDVEAILLDDAFQHRSVKAGVNMLITDYSKPFYKDMILPMGTLRESPKAYKRADVIVVSKCPPNLSLEEAEEMKGKINPIGDQRVYFSTVDYHTPYDLLSHQQINLTNKNVVLVCCIAKPDPFVAYIKQKAKEVHTLTYNDHHYFLKRDMEEIKEAFDTWDVKDKVIVTTEKDAARLALHIDTLKEWGISIVIIPIAVSFLFQKGPEFDSFILNYVANTINESNMLYGEEG
ncbi:MAG: tetraacyldisaccharide 4'-kinase [Flavipsychrobacter sp.]